MNDIVSVPGSSGALFPLPGSTGTSTIRALKCFIPLYQPPSPPYLSFACLQEKTSEGPKAFQACSPGASRSGPGLLAARKSFSAEKLKGLLLLPRLSGHQSLEGSQPPHLLPVPLGPSASAAPPTPSQTLVTPRPAWHRRQFPGSPAQELGPQHLERSDQSFLLRLESPS